MFYQCFNGFLSCSEHSPWGYTMIQPRMTSDSKIHPIVTFHSILGSIPLRFIRDYNASVTLMPSIPGVGYSVLMATSSLLP